MAEQETTDSAVAESASTSAEAGAAEPTVPTGTPTQTEAAPSADALWDSVGKGTGETSTGEQEKPAEEAEPTDTTAGNTGADEAEDPEEDLISDLFKEEDEPAETADESKPEDEGSEEEKLDKADPKEMAERQRNKDAKKYLERTERYATPLKDLKAGRIAPSEALKALEPIMGAEPLQKLKQEAAHELVDANPEATFRRAYAIKKLAADPEWDPQTATIPSLDEIIAGPVTASDAAAPADLSELVKGLDDVIGWDWRDETLDDQFQDDRELVMAKTIRSLEATAAQAVADKEAADERATEAQKQAKTVVESKQTDDQKAVADALNTRITEFRSSVDSKILPHVLRDTGLEVSTDDTPEIAEFKQLTAEMYQGTEYEKANSLPSRFESFLENEWSGRDRVEAVYTRIVENLLKAEMAARAKDKDAEKAALDDVKEDRIPLFTLVSEANKEFKKKYIEPGMKLIGAAWEKKAATVNPGRDRKEIVSSAAPARQTPPKKTFESVDDIYDNVVREAQNDRRLAATQ